VDQAKKHKWQEKREQYQTRASDAYIEKHAARRADREAQVRDKALDAIDEAITRLRSDLKATKRKLVNGEWVEVPAMRLTPKDLAVLRSNERPPQPARCSRRGRWSKEDHPMGIKLDVSVETPLTDDDRDILAGISAMMLAIANRQNLADQPHMQDEGELEGMEPAPCGSPSRDEPTRYCIREVGHSGRHKYLRLNGSVN
jgi:hypothetical protein